MFFFGHIGVTGGLVRVCQQISVLGKPDNNRPREENNPSTAESPETLLKLNTTNLAGNIDYRLVLIGSMLPDILDKPPWMVMSSYFPLAGRGYAHTFLFSFILLIPGIFLIIFRKKLWLLLLSLCSFSHLALDEMWLNPVTLWWPLFGPIQAADTEDWLFNVWRSLVSVPKIYVTEILGLAICLYFGVRLIKNRKVVNFIKTGRIE